MAKASRKQQILESLAHELEKSPGERITTAGLAKAVFINPVKFKFFSSMTLKKEKQYKLRLRKTK